MDPDPDPRKEIEVDPDLDLDPERGLKWIRIRPNAVNPGGSGSGSETLVTTVDLASGSSNNYGTPRNYKTIELY